MTTDKMVRRYAVNRKIGENNQHGGDEELWNGCKWGLEGRGGRTRMKNKSDMSFETMFVSYNRERKAPILVYGADTWALKKAQEMKMEVAEMQML